MAEVRNLRNGKMKEGEVYVGRPSKWGNPFVIGKDGTRDEVIAKYEEWVSDGIDNGYLDITELTGKDLVCWCAPLACHADVLLRLARESESPSTAPMIIHRIYTDLNYSNSVESIGLQFSDPWIHDNWL